MPTPPGESAGLAGRARRFLPILGWLPRYDRGDLGPDLVAGVTTWGVMVPVALAYASLAGLPPEYGLITAFAALAAYAVFGTSRHLRVTTSSTMAIMSVSLVTPLAAGDADRFLALTAALALVVGGLLLIAGVARLGFISEFLAKPVVTGFIMGVAITIIVGQLPKLLGIPGSSGSVLDQLRSLASHLSEVDGLTMLIGVGALLLILVLRVVDRRIPGAFIAMVLGIGLVTALGLAQQGVAVVGEVATVMPSLGLPHIGLGDLTYLVTGAAGIVFLAVGESLGAARSFAVRHHYAIDGDQELVALGAANVSSGLFGGFIVDASLSQSATAEAAGTRTQLSGLVTAGLVLATALLLAPLFESLPWAVLAAIVIASVLSLIDLDEVRRYWAWRRADAILAVAALIGVATTDVLLGLLIAVLLSLLMLLLRASRPDVVSLGRLPGDRELYADLERNPAAEASPRHPHRPPRRAPLLLQRQLVPSPHRGPGRRAAGTTRRGRPRHGRHLRPGRDHHGHAGAAPRRARRARRAPRPRPRQGPCPRPPGPNGIAGAPGQRWHLLLGGTGRRARGAARGRTYRRRGSLTPAAAPTRGAGPAPARAGRDGSARSMKSR